MRHDDAVTLGRAGVPATRLALGTAPLGGMYSTVADDDAADAVTAALAAGIRYVDTAPFYGAGSAERRLGAGLAAARATAAAAPGAGTTGGAVVTVSTKVGRVLVPGRPDSGYVWTDAGEQHPVFDFSAGAVRAGLEASLQRLGLDAVDIVLIHDPDEHEEQALTEAYPELARMRAEGLVRAIGIGMNQTRIPTRFVEETDVDVVLIAGRWTLLDQSAQRDLLPAARRRGVSVVAGGVFNSGVLADPGPDARFEYAPAPPGTLARVAALREVLDRFDVPLTAAALQFPFRHPAVDVVLVGARSRAEVDEDVAAFDRPVPEQCWTALTEAGLIDAGPIEPREQHPWHRAPH